MKTYIIVLLIFAFLVSIYGIYDAFKKYNNKKIMIEKNIKKMINNDFALRISYLDHCLIEYKEFTQSILQVKVFIYLQNFMLDEAKEVMSIMNKKRGYYVYCIVIKHFYILLLNAISSSSIEDDEYNQKILLINKKLKRSLYKFEPLLRIIESIKSTKKFDLTISSTELSNLDNYIVSYPFTTIIHTSLYYYLVMSNNTVKVEKYYNSMQKGKEKFSIYCFEWISSIKK